MVFVSAKSIRGEKRYYLEESVRLPSGEVKKFSVYLPSYNPKKKYNLQCYRETLKKKTAKVQVDWASGYYEKDYILNEKLIRKLEDIRLGYKEILRKLNKNQLRDVIDRFAVNFTYESNAIEGNSLTLKDVAIVLHEKKAVEGKDLREIYETLNTRKAMELIFHNKLKINEKDILKLHKLLVKDLNITTGYKKLPNFILGRDVQTTPPERVRQEMKKLMDWYHENNKIHPLQRAAIFHGLFERIHPFEDGNGRVGRLLINIILFNYDYPPLIIRKTSRLSYFKALEAFDKKHRDKLIRFLIEKHKNTYEKFFKVYVSYLK